MIQIDKGIPIPGRGRKAKYPWRQMEVGDSFIIINTTNRSCSRYVGWANKLYVPLRFVGRTMPDGNYRIWRVA